MNLSSKVHKTKGTENQQVTKISKSDNNKESIKQSEKAQVSILHYLIINNFAVLLKLLIKVIYVYIYKLYYVLFSL